MKYNWKKYISEFRTVFLSVSLAFGLGKWNENRKERNSEQRILREIKAGLEADKSDMYINIAGNKSGLHCSQIFRDLVNGKARGADTLNIAFHGLLRDLVVIQNDAAYSALKSQGLNLIQNDSLRMAIISIYGFSYEILEKLEETYSELQFNENYFKPISEAFLPYFILDNQGNIIDIHPVNFTELERKRILFYLARIDLNRRFILQQYEDCLVEIDELIESIDQNLKS